MQPDCERRGPADQAAPLWIRLAPGIFLLLWSAGYSFGKMALKYAEPMTLLALRYGLVLVLLVPFLAVLRPPRPRHAIDWLHLIVVGLLIQAGYFGLFYAALGLGMSAGAGALILSLQPIMVALLAPFLAGERVDGKHWIALALGLAGAAIVIAARSTIEITSAVALLSCAGALFCITVGSLYEKRFGMSHHPVMANFIQYAAAFLAILPAAWLMEDMRIAWTGEFVLSLAYLVIANSLIAVTLMLAMIRRGAVSRVSMLLFLVPPVAAVFAWLMIAEPMPALAWLGMALAAVGIAMAGPAFWRRLDRA
ncbi:MAG: DMT family transporter [Dongiaceae bacterium]